MEGFSWKNNVDYPSRDEMLKMYELMVRARKFDEFIVRSFKEYPGLIRGHTHPSIGQEAIAVGSVMAMRPEDYLGTTYRCHAYAIAKGIPLKNLLAEIWGKATGVCKGKGGSMHICDMSRNFLPANGIVAQGIPQATGVALKCQINKEDKVVVSVFGDGATKQGAFFESLNIASIWKLPIVFILENNLYQAYTRVDMEDANAMNGEPLSMKAKAFSMRGVTIDGMDVLEVYQTVKKAIEKARRGEGPTLIEAITYRYTAHGNSIVPPPIQPWYPEHEAIEIYKRASELEEWRKRDPIIRLKKILLNLGIADNLTFDSIERKINEELSEAIRYALQSPYPPPEEALKDIYV
ncbi:acetoin:2,6-dichlorophenolindophenol oxidoreductase subunit alpha [Sulfolobus acidocaldarius SUSAZ]|nr:acetoin:2,6-dichlorophenolindophenol oxidoreductase subunit alpha [Sulfolobus acidocaldarius SUSAZ]